MTNLTGATVETQLERVLDALLLGRISLHQLTPSLSGFYTAGFDAGRASLSRELEQARADASLYYSLAHSTPEQRADLIARRMDAASAGHHETDEAQYASMLAATISPRRAAA